MLAGLVMVAALASWPAPLRAAVEAETAPSKLAFTMNVDTESGRFVVTRDFAGNWVLREPAGPATKPTEQALAALKRMKPEHDLSCAARAEGIPAAVTLKSETPSEAVYEYTPKPAPGAQAQLVKAAAHSRAEIRVSKTDPRILGGRVWLQSPFSPAPFSKVNDYSETYLCMPTTDGAQIMARSSFALDLSALGARHQISRETRLSDVRD